MIHSILAYVKFACNENLAQTIEKQIVLQSVHIVTLRGVLVIFTTAPHLDTTQAIWLT